MGVLIFFDWGLCSVYLEVLTILVLGVMQGTGSPADHSAAASRPVR